MEEIKLRFLESPRFYVNEAKRKVTCVLVGYLDNPDILFCDEIKGVGTSTCHEDDEFNINVGKRIAYCKAENNAYKKAKNLVLERLSKTLKNSMLYSKFIEKTHATVDHNVNYIDNISVPGTEMNERAKGEFNK